MNDQQKKKLKEIEEEERDKKKQEIKSIMNDVKEWEKAHKISFREALLLELIYRISENNQ